MMVSVGQGKRKVEMSDQFKYGNFYLTTAAVIPLLYITLSLQVRFVEAFNRPFRRLTIDMWKPMAAAKGFPAGIRTPIYYIRFWISFLLIATLLIAGVAIVIATIISEGLSLWALMVASDNALVRVFVFASTLSLVVMLAVPTIINIYSNYLSNEPAREYISGGFASLQAANEDEVRRKSAARSATEEQSEAQHRNRLNGDAQRELQAIANVLQKTISKAAPLAILNKSDGIGWTISMNEAELKLSPPVVPEDDPWGFGWKPAFNVIAFSSLQLIIPRNRFGYRGRSHSLWYCDAHKKGSYDWYEVAFVLDDFSTKDIEECPFKLDPSSLAAQAIGPGMSEVQLAGLSRLRSAYSIDFLSRWAGWFAEAASGQLNWPGAMRVGQDRHH
jgi:hypothetical protein